MAPVLSSITEGRTRLFVPALSLSSRTPPTHPVFFNPAAKLNRDISVAVAHATRPRTYLDVLAGTGARGVRVANESGKATSVTLADFNEASLALAKRNVRANGLADRCEVVHQEANRLMYSRFDRGEKFDAVDVDPFGSPAPYLQAATVASADDATLSFTATDAAVLCAVYPSVTLRRYGASAFRSEFVHETALRILIGFAARSGGVNDIGVEPVAAHSTLHYLRAVLKVRRGASKADEAIKELGYVTQCNTCGARSSTPSQLSSCQDCGGKVRSAGPLWTGAMTVGDLITASLRFCEKEGFEEAASTLASLIGLDDFPPYSYSLERACSRLRAPSVPIEKVMEALRGRGFASAPSPFDELTVKTPASYKELLDCVKEVSGAAA